jgi:hypothetical protein
VGEGYLRGDVKGGGFTKKTSGARVYLKQPGSRGGGSPGKLLT